MEGWRIIMDVGIATVVAVLLGAVLSFLFNIWVDSKGWKKVNEKIGDTSKGSLNIQHEDIKDSIKIRTEGIEKSIVNKTDNIEKSIIERTSNIFTKVDKINDITVKNETLYQNLDVEQKEIRNNVNKLVLDWERTISENKNLKSQIDYLRQEKHELRIKEDKTTEKLNKLKKTIEKNDTLKYENLELRNEVDSLKSKNSGLVSQNQELLITNKDLSKKLDTAKKMLGIEKISQEQVNEINKEKEGEWDMEL